MLDRSRAREVVFQLLFQDDQHPHPDVKASDRFVHDRLHHRQSLVDFALELLWGTRQKRANLDAELTLQSPNWSLRRMSVADRNILRLAAYELRHTATPRSIVINEAVELAKRFGTESSPAFVNGILDGLPEQAPPEKVAEEVRSS